MSITPTYTSTLPPYGWSTIPKYGTPSVSSFDQSRLFEIAMIQTRFDDMVKFTSTPKNNLPSFGGINAGMPTMGMGMPFMNFPTMPGMGMGFGMATNPAFRTPYAGMSGMGQPFGNLTMGKVPKEMKEEMKLRQEEQMNESYSSAIETEDDLIEEINSYVEEGRELQNDIQGCNKDLVDLREKRSKLKAPSDKDKDEALQEKYRSDLQYYDRKIDECSRSKREKESRLTTIKRSIANNKRKLKNAQKQTAMVERQARKAGVKIDRVPASERPKLESLTSSNYSIDEPVPVQPQVAVTEPETDGTQATVSAESPSASDVETSEQESQSQVVQKSNPAVKKGDVRFFDKENKSYDITIEQAINLANSTDFKPDDKGFVEITDGDKTHQIHISYFITGIEKAFGNNDKVTVKTQDGNDIEIRKSELLSKLGNLDTNKSVESSQKFADNSNIGDVFTHLDEMLSNDNTKELSYKVGSQTTTIPRENFKENIMNIFSNRAYIEIGDKKYNKGDIEKLLDDAHQRRISYCKKMIMAEAENNDLNRDSYLKRQIESHMSLREAQEALFGGNDSDTKIMEFANKLLYTGHNGAANVEFAKWLLNGKVDTEDHWFGEDNETRYIDAELTWDMDGIVQNLVNTRCRLQWANGDAESKYLDFTDKTKLNEVQHRQIITETKRIVKMYNSQIAGHINAGTFMQQGTKVG